jgi:hypothetical protein
LNGPYKSLKIVYFQWLLSKQKLSVSAIKRLLSDPKILIDHRYSGRRVGPRILVQDMPVALQLRPDLDSGRRRGQDHAPHRSVSTNAMMNPAPLYIWINIDHQYHRLHRSAPGVPAAGRSHFRRASSQSCRANARAHSGRTARRGRGRPGPWRLASAACFSKRETEDSKWR